MLHNYSVSYGKKSYKLVILSYNLRQAVQQWHFGVKVEVGDHVILYCGVALIWVTTHHYAF